MESEVIELFDKYASINKFKYSHDFILNDSTIIHILFLKAYFYHSLTLKIINPMKKISKSITTKDYLKLITATMVDTSMKPTIK